MSDSRFLRMVLLVVVWAGAVFAISQSAIPLFKRRRTGSQKPVEVASLTSASMPSVPEELKSKRLRAPRLQRIVLVGLVAALLLVVLGQALFMLHVPIPNVFSYGSSTPNGATFITQHPTATVTRTQAFESGIVTPQWQQKSAYDGHWQQSLSDIQTQTGAKWIELSLLFSQPTSTSTTVSTTQSTPLVSSFAAGVHAAHAKGFHVFVVPLMGVQQKGGWAGTINFTSQAQEQAWFDSYWNTFKPYVQAAAEAGADQMAIATECTWLQQHAPATLWNELIARVHSIFSGTLTYDMNWDPVDQPIPVWFNNANLRMIGVSSYIPLTDVSKRIDPKDMPALWKSKVGDILDTISTRVGKPVLISEIGYRNSSNALYNSWEQDSTSPLDPAEQAGAYEAALTNAVSDQRIAGIFFWGWEDVGKFTLKGQDMTNAVLHKWYTSAQ